jgi:anti-sigma-K factor RskA
VSERPPTGCGESRRDDLAAYALGALGDEESARLERHLADCETCSERLRWLQPAVDLLPASVQQLEPPPELRSRLLETVRAEAVEAPVSPDPTAHPVLEQPPRKGLRLPWLSGGGLRPALAGLALAALLVVGAIAGYSLRDGDGDGSRQYAAAPLSERVEASGRVTVEGNSGALHVEDMPAIPREEVYQVWVRHDQDVLPSSIFVVTRDGTGEVAIPDKLEGADEILVTREPAGGSEVATTDPMLSAPLN